MSEKTVQLFDAATIDNLPWPASCEEPDKQFLIHFVKNGTKYYVDNVDTQFVLLLVEDVVIPITINDTQYDNSFVCSPFSQYISYALMLGNKIPNKILKVFFESMMKSLSSIVKFGKINKVVTVNNWLFSTNPTPPINKRLIPGILDFLKQRFPEHAILFRSIIKETGPECYDALKQVGFNLLATRYVWILQGSKEEVFQTRIFKSDLRFIRDSQFAIVEPEELTEQDILRIQQLYYALYIQKYSALNPQFNAEFIRMSLKSGFMNFKGIKLNDKLEGIIGFYCRQGVMVSAFFGYDPEGTENKGAYRYLCTLLMQEARKQKVCFNQSAGGSFYKKIRRAEGHMEYSAIYHKHLPFSRKIPWVVLKTLLNSAGKVIMQKY